MRRPIFGAVLVVAFGSIAVPFAASCVTSTPMKRPDGSTEFYLTCGTWASSYSGCIEEANKLCPTGWLKLSEDSSWASGKEMRINCPAPSTGPVTIIPQTPPPPSRPDAGG